MRQMERQNKRKQFRWENRNFVGREPGSRDPFCARVRAAEAGEFMLERLRKAQRANGKDDEEEEKMLRARDIRASVGCQPDVNKGKIGLVSWR